MTAPTSFKDASWAARFEKMGDEAEGRFEAYAEDELKKGYVRFGLNRPPLQMSMLPTRLRYTPDYLMSGGFVECKGLGRDQLLKLKLENLNSLHYWHGLHPVEVYVWDSFKKRECIVPLYEIDKIINDGHATLAHFPEGKAYFAIPAERLFDAA